MELIEVKPVGQSWRYNPTRQERCSPNVGPKQTGPKAGPKQALGGLCSRCYNGYSDATKELSFEGGAAPKSCEAIINLVSENSATDGTTSLSFSVSHPRMSYVYSSISEEWKL